MAGEVAGVFAPSMGEEMSAELQDALTRMMPKRTKRRKMTVADARKILEAEEAEKLIDQDAVARARPSKPPRISASSSSTRSTKSPAAGAATVRTSRAKACSAICCRSSKVHRSARAMD